MPDKISRLINKLTSEHNGLAQVCSLNLVRIDTPDAAIFRPSLDVSAQPKTSYAIFLHPPEKHIFPTTAVATTSSCTGYSRAFTRSDLDRIMSLLTFGFKILL
jgi:hypothetical protein